ncbi:hypothetical protein ACFTWF_16995 [Rhodococcus sp. NPDC056960]|uniref:Rv1733c family protein n=1 Tax=Rhodococcus sp. NPDC056960 TaxID=3345982 RepID=UPI00363DCE39
MTGGNAVPVRWWRLAPWSGNPLMRRSDRIESTIVLVVVVVALMVVPVAGAVGTATYTRLTERAHQVAGSGRQVPAVLLDDPRPPPGEIPMRGPAGRDQAPARWVLEGTEHTGVVETDIGARAGQTVTVWVDADGNFMQPPNSGTESGIEAISAAIMFLILGITGCGLLLAGTHGALARYRRSRWQREWQSLGHRPGWPVS